MALHQGFSAGFCSVHDQSWAQNSTREQPSTQGLVIIPDKHCGPSQHSLATFNPGKGCIVVAEDAIAATSTWGWFPREQAWHRAYMVHHRVDATGVLDMTVTGNVAFETAKQDRPTGFGFAKSKCI